MSRAMKATAEGRSLGRGRNGDFRIREIRSDSVRTNVFGRTESMVIVDIFSGKIGKRAPIELVLTVDDAIALESGLKFGLQSIAVRERRGRKNATRYTPPVKSSEYKQKKGKK